MAALGDEDDADELERVWNLLAEPRVGSSPEELDEAWARVRDRLAGSDAHPGERAAPTHDTIERNAPAGSDARTPAGSASRWWVRGLLAAAAVAALALGLEPLTSVTVEAGPGESRSVTLGDGTIVELNSGSSLSQPPWTLPWAAPARGVVLVGEAFFEVAPDEVPFMVETFNARVTVLGTRFNVRARDEIGGGTEVVLETGRVRFLTFRPEWSLPPRCVL